MAYTIGGISGYHINPAVTIGLFVANKVEKSLLLFYIIGQISGGLLGGGVRCVRL
jgi:aquaporin Z